MCVYPHHSHGIFPRCLVTMSHESDVEHYVHQLKKKKKKTGLRDDSRKKWGETPIAQSSEFCFIIMKGESLTPKGSPTKDENFSRASGCQATHVTAVGSLGRAATCGQGSLCCRGCLGDTLHSYGLVFSVTKVNQDSMLGERSKWPRFNRAFSLDIP